MAGGGESHGEDEKLEEEEEDAAKEGEMHFLTVIWVFVRGL